MKKAVEEDQEALYINSKYKLLNKYFFCTNLDVIL